MATEAQIIANRRNAQKSSGPKTLEGKARSRMNALDHGLAAVLPDSVGGRAVVEERKELWREDFRPSGETQEYLFEQVVVESLRIERCQEIDFSLCKQHGDRARVQWEADRHREANQLAEGLTKNPQVIAAKLESTPQGCGVKLALWTGLLSSLAVHRDWTENQRALALGLLGIHPDLRDAETPVDPANGDVFALRIELVNREIARLTHLRDEVLVGLDANERAMAESTLGAEFTRPMQLLDRYERACVRRQSWAWRKFDAAKREASPASPLSAKTVDKPVPRPEPEPERPTAPDLDPPVPVDLREDRAEPAQTPLGSRPVGLNRRQRRRLAALQRRAG